MSKLKILLLCLMSYHGFSLGQEVNIKYEMNVYPNTFISYYDLKISDKISSWEFIGYTDNNSSDEDAIQEPSSTKLKFFHADNSYMYQEKLLGKRIDVIDSPEMKWELTERIDTINNFPCQYAKTEFRGRNYTACYSKEIKINQGPWKFKGLPGLIVYISSEDDFIEYTIQSITALGETNLNRKFEEYLSAQFISFEEFQKQFIRVYNNLIKSMKSKKEDSSFNSYYKINKAEIIYPDLQIGHGIVY